MSIIAEAIRPARRSTLSSPEQWFIDWITGGAEASSGAKVNQKSALRYTPFWSAVRIISGTLASLPFHVYRRLSNGGKDRDMSHSAYGLMHDRPNEYMDAVTFIETRQAHVLTYGNGYAEIQRDGAGRPIALWPLLPDRIERKISKSGIPYYEVRMQTGGSVTLPDYNVLHIKGLGFDGYTGYDVVTYHKEAIGYGIGTKEYAARFFGNSANPGGVLEHPKSLSDKAYNRIKKSWKAGHEGISQAHRMQILEEGMKWSPIGVDPEKAQALETQKFNVDDCSRIFNIPPHKLGSMDRATFNNIEEQNLDFFAFTMMYWFRKWEQECSYKLLMPSERKTKFCEFLVNAILRGKIQDRYEAYSKGRQWGWLSADDIREFENLNPLPNDQGKIYLQPLNMVPATNQPPVRSNNVRAHLDLIRSQLLRIVHKHNGIIDRGDKPDLRQYAITLLYEPARAWASVFGDGEVNVRDILASVINELTIRTDRLTEDDADVMAGQIIQRIGGINHALCE